MNKKIIEIVLKHYPTTQAIYLFGSIVKGQETNSSDVDLAILLPFDEAKNVRSFLGSDLENDLALMLQRDVDLINLRQVNTIVQFQIIESGKAIFCADSKEQGLFEISVMGKYQILNFERKEILEDFYGKK